MESLLSHLDQRKNEARSARFLLMKLPPKGIMNNVNNPILSANIKPPFAVFFILEQFESLLSDLWRNKKRT
jgi:hypothetical protein